MANNRLSGGYHNSYNANQMRDFLHDEYPELVEKYGIDSPAMDLLLGYIHGFGKTSIGVFKKNVEVLAKDTLGASASEADVRMLAGIYTDIFGTKEKSAAVEGALSTRLGEVMHGDSHPIIVDYFGLQAQKYARSPEARMSCPVMGDIHALALRELQKVIAGEGIEIFVAGNIYTHRESGAQYEIVSFETILFALGKVYDATDYEESGKLEPVSFSILRENIGKNDYVFYKQLDEGEKMPASTLYARQKTDFMKQFSPET